MVHHIDQFLVLKREEGVESLLWVSQWKDFSIDDLEFPKNGLIQC